MAKTIIDLDNNPDVTIIRDADDSLQQAAGEAAEAMEDILDEFSDEVPGEEATEEQKKEAEGFLKKFTDFIKSQTFKDSVNEAAKEHGIPPKKVAEGFFSKCLGTIGDILGVAIAVGDSAGHTLINILSAVAHGAVNLLTKVASGLARIVSFNYTCVDECVA